MGIILAIVGGIVVGAFGAFIAFAFWLAKAMNW